MKVKYTILDPANPDVSRIGELECPDDGSDSFSEITNYYALNALWKANFPGDMEHVTVWHEGQYTDMFVDDSGAIKNLSINNQATQIYWANAFANDPIMADMTEDRKLIYAQDTQWPRIHGPAILFHSKVWH